MAVALAVVVDRLALQGVLDRGNVDPAALGALGGPLERRERHPGIAAAALGQHRQGLVVDRRRINQAPLGIGQRPPQQLHNLLRLQRPQLVDLGAGEQG